MRGQALVLAAILVVAGCVGSDRAGDRTTVRIDDATWTVLLAGEDGMRGLTDFDGADGMLFTFDAEVDPRQVLWVMDHVPVPLDIAWFAGSGELVGTASMPLCPAEPCPHHAAPAPYRWAIEASPGAFDHLQAGARLVIEGR